MSEEIEILLKFCEEEWEQRRQSENQRATITNFIITIAIAIIVVIVQRGLKVDSLPLAVLLILLGFYGAVTSAKLYERGQYHISRANQWRERINELCPNAKLLENKDRANIKHASQYRVLIKIRLHSLWVVLHISIVLAGLICVLLIILK